MTKAERKEQETLEIQRILSEANEAKERLAGIAGKLEELGKRRKANALMSLVWKIEVWQNTPV